MLVSLAKDRGKLAIRLCPASSILRWRNAPSSSGSARSWLLATISTRNSRSCPIPAGRVFNSLRNKLRTRSEAFRQIFGGTEVKWRPLRSSLSSSPGLIFLRRGRPSLFCDFGDEDRIRFQRQRIGNTGQRLVEAGERDAKLRRSETEWREIEADFLLGCGHVDKNKKRFAFVAAEISENVGVV